MSKTEKPEKKIAVVPYILGMISFGYSVCPPKPILLYLAIIFMFTAFMKPIYDWNKQNKKNGESDGNKEG